VVETLAGIGIDVWRVCLPTGLDANAYAVRSGNPEYALGLALEQAVRMSHSENSGDMVASETIATSGESSPSLAARPVVHPEAVACEVSASGELLLRSGPRAWRVRGRAPRSCGELPSAGYVPRGVNGRTAAETACHMPVRDGRRAAINHNAGDYTHSRASPCTPHNPRDALVCA